MTRSNAGVVIVGAGPAGVATALTICQIDPSMTDQLVVLDGATFPRHKPCGGGLTKRGQAALAQLRLSMPPPSAQVQRVRLRTTRREVTFEAFDRYFDVFDRTEFDNWLVCELRARGVLLLEGERVTSVLHSDGHFTVQTPNVSLETEVLVAADGASSNVRRCIAPEPVRLSRLLEVVRPASDWDANLAEFDFSVLANGVQGYAWTFPAWRQGELVVNQGIFDSRLVESKPRSPLPQILREVLCLDGKENHEICSHPIRPWRRGAVGAEGVLFVGDALGADGLLGEGISVAIENGIAAGRAIATGAVGPGLVAEYERQLTGSALIRDLATRRRLARVLYATRRTGPVATDALVRAARLVDRMRRRRLGEAAPRD